MTHLAFWWVFILLHRPFFHRRMRDPDNAVDHVKVCSPFRHGPSSPPIIELRHSAMQTCLRQHYGIDEHMAICVHSPLRAHHTRPDRVFSGYRRASVGEQGRFWTPRREEGLGDILRPSQSLHPVPERDGKVLAQFHKDRRDTRQIIQETIGPVDAAADV